MSDHPVHRHASPARDGHRLPVHEIVLLYETDLQHGLAPDEAQRRLSQVGPNELPRIDRRGPLLRLLMQFHHPLIYVLLAAALATMAVGEVVDASVIAGVVVIIAVIGYFQESRAEKALDSLMAMVRTEATVLREGARLRVPSSRIVPGDVVLLDGGDKVPADVRLTLTQELRVDESALTGESAATVKSPVELPPDTGLGDRSNMAYSGTLVTRGSGRGVVVATGADTEIGRIHRLIGAAQTLQTPLTRKLARFSRILTVAILALAAMTFALGLARGEPIVSMLTAAVALAVGAIPEGLPAVVTITLAIGVARMARRRAIIRRLPAVETLGSTTVICTDKTGTLTANAMTVTALRAGEREYTVTGTGYAPHGHILSSEQPVESGEHPALRACLLAGALCNDARLVQQQDGRWDMAGDPTEGALLAAAAKGGLDVPGLRAAMPRLDTLPFDSSRRYMATLHRHPDGRVFAYVKGAVEQVVSMAEGRLGPDGEESALDAEELNAHAEELASEALRVLAFAHVELAATTTALSEELLEGSLTVLGVQGMFDPPRPDALAAVAACQAAGVDVKMITGDHAATARAVAERFRIASPASEIVTGAGLHACPEEELSALVARTAVFARVSPEQKLRLVENLQAGGHVVAMTGDGINDAPALRRADIGVAMGVSGTEVAKDASDMVLTDDDFASIEAAVEEGRGVFDNLRKFITFTLPTSMGQGLVILAAVLLATALPILPVQMLWVNMTTAVALGLVLAFEPMERDVMRRPPVPPSRPLLTRDIVGRIVLVSTIMLLGAFTMFHWELAQGTAIDEARTVAVNLVVMVQVAYLLNCRSLERSPLSVGLLSNPWVGVGIAAMITLQGLFTYAPWMNHLFHTAPLDATAWMRILAVSVAAYLVVETEKWLRRTWRASEPGVA